MLWFIVCFNEVVILKSQQDKQERHFVELVIVFCSAPKFHFIYTRVAQSWHY